LATRSATPLGPHSIIPTWWSHASSATAKLKRARSRPRGSPTSSSTRSPTGAVLPILHLNGYKISNPTVLARIEHEELEQFLRGCGWTPYFVEGDDPAAMHELMATTLDDAIKEIRRIQGNARDKNDAARQRWPMIVLRSPKGWTGPKVVDGLQIEGTFRAHQVPLLVDADHPITSSSSKAG